MDMDGRRVHGRVGSVLFFMSPSLSLTHRDTCTLHAGFLQRFSYTCLLQPLYSFLFHGTKGRRLDGGGERKNNTSMNIQEYHDNTKIHPVTAEGIAPSKELGRALTALRYDLLLPVLEGMIEEAYRERDGDEKRGRVKLSKELDSYAVSLAQAKSHLEKMVAICRPYIEREKQKQEEKS